MIFLDQIIIVLYLCLGSLIACLIIQYEENKTRDAIHKYIMEPLNKVSNNLNRLDAITKSLSKEQKDDLKTEINKANDLDELEEVMTKWENKLGINKEK